MNKQFIRKTSQFFIIIGALTCVYNTIRVLFFGAFSLFNVITIAILLLVIGFIYIFGVKIQTKIVAYIQIATTYLVIYASFFSDPCSIPGILLSITSYFLLCEYQVIKTLWQKIIAICTYIIPILISLFMINNKIPDIGIFMITAFFIFFLKMYIEHKKNQEIKQTEKAIKLLDELQASNIESIKTANESLWIAEKLCGDLKQEQNCIEQMRAI